MLRLRRLLWPAGLAGLALAAGVAVLGPRLLATGASTTARAAALPPAGYIDAPPDEAIVATTAVVSGWALDAAGVRGVSLRLPDGRAVAGRYGLPRPDVATAVPGYPNSAASGFEVRAAFDGLGAIRHPLSVVVTNAAGSERVLGQRSLIPPEAFRLWPAAARTDGATPPAFHYLMATSNVAAGWAGEVKATYRAYESTTHKVGIAVPVLFMRTTKGRAGDWAFDASFDVARKCGSGVLVEDSLAGVLRSAIAHRVPVQIILNGGIWGDATCGDPEWDLTDHLEQAPENCQWTQDNHVFADDHLKNLPGSTASPELARALTFNVYASRVRAYKRRNLQDAARVVARFAREHPQLFVGVNLDSDAYINPFFEEREWFDYNPATLRQFREWLRGEGPYAGRGGPGVPDLRAWRRARPLSLADVNRIARRSWTSWSQVDPPRRFPGSQREAARPGETPIWDDPWYWEWDTFRKHLVALHYAELAQWTHEAGVPRERIHTSMGFVAPIGEHKPFALRIASHGQNYDSGGVSVEGAIPPHGHLGAILYGPAAENRVRMEHRHGLFATFARMDPGWAVVEMNTADLRQPDALPSYAQAYRAFRDLFNYDARQAALMAWTGSNGIYAGQPGYVSYTSWRNTPAEEAMRDHMIAHANLPRGSRLWTFGTSRHADDDGWSLEGGTLAAGRGRITLRPQRSATSVALLSPRDQVIRRPLVARLVIGGLPDSLRGDLEVWAERAPGSGWQRLGATSAGRASRIAAGTLVDLAWPRGWPDAAIVERLKIVVTADALPAELTIERIALIGRDG